MATFHDFVARAANYGREVDVICIRSLRPRDGNNAFTLPSEPDRRTACQEVRRYSGGLLEHAGAGSVFSQPFPPQRYQASRKPNFLPHRSPDRANL